MPTDENRTGGGRRSGRAFIRRPLAAASLFLSVFVLVAVSAGGPVASRILGHGPNDPFPYAVNLNLKPVGPLARVPDTHEANADDYGRVLPPHTKRTTLLILGGDGPLGRDEFLRLLDGGRVSLEVAFSATALAALFGSIVGAVGAFIGGVLDAAIARLTEFMIGFPLLLFLVMVGSTFSGRLDSVTVHGVLPRGVVSIVLTISAFTWFYPARIVRAQVRSLRNQEFIEAAEMVGATRRRIIFRHLVPHLMPTVAAYCSTAIATNILLEASVTFLGVGIHLPTASWGSMLADTWGTVSDPRPWDPTRDTVWQALFPTLAITLAVFAFNHLGEALADRAELERPSAA